MFMVLCFTNLYYKCPTRCNNKQSIFHFTARSLYVFWVPFTPIIRSILNCSYSQWYKSYGRAATSLQRGHIGVLFNGFYLLHFPTHWDIWRVPVAVTTVSCTTGDGCERHPKHVEGSCSKIKYRPLIVASRWTFIIYNILCNIKNLMEHTVTTRLKSVQEVCCWEVD